MRFDLTGIPESKFPREPALGDVYAAKGGNGRTAFWLLVAMSQTGQSGHYLGLSCEGQIVSTASYAHHAMRERSLVGFVPLADFCLPALQCEVP